jgi:hypothetical protein
MKPSETGGVVEPRAVGALGALQHENPARYREAV